ncbi:hypothetical protein CFC21_095346 [Triticum aestivum]|uniref:PGG domain-containing protein n=2 Tax=Triticum aestivum TaxID=4565 RepID=A0A9R1LPV8_WHEAT|nr:uncharacterized protein LOC123151624 [Triticum aestivum]KAF7092895.1 hypothetical protein CFC21_095346 [Triticum aestivum]
MANEQLVQQQQQGQGDEDDDSKLYEFKEQLLLLSTLVATVTYVAGLNLPGGSWEQDDPGGHMAGDPILMATHYRRYLAFYYCNATALATSLVVSLILVILPKNSTPWTVVLQMVMVLDLLGLMGAYGAGSCRDAFTTIYAVAAFSFSVLVIISVFLSFLAKANRDDAISSDAIPITTNGDDNKVHPKSLCNLMKIGIVKLFEKGGKNRGEKEMVDVLMLLAAFVVTITYVAGLNPPRGFSTSTQEGHRLSDPVLQARNRYRVFFICNTTSFVVSLLIIVLLLEKKLLGKKKLRLVALCGLIVVALLGLMGAYAAGSCREASKTVLVLAVPVCVCLLLALVFIWGSLVDRLDSVFTRFKQLVKIPSGTARLDSVFTRFKELVKTPSGTCTGTNVDLHEQITRDLVMLLATLVVTITYQAGLDPPGGLWLDDRDGHNIGHPVLQTTYPTRYRVFFYSNSAAFVTSLVVIMMLQSKFLLNRHTLEATLVLDLFGLITAYGAGNTREVTQSIYIVALAGIVLVYVIVHITIRDHDAEPVDDEEVKHLDDKRKVLLLVAVLAATLTYQAGLTPPGGFWLADDRELGHRAGFPILLDNYTRRYNTFFYCNAASFMASVTLILLLVNPKLYRPGIRCRALYVCMLVGMFGLMGAYAAGSSRNLKTSVYVLTLVGAVLAFIASLLAIFLLGPYLKSQEGRDFCFVPFGKSQKGTDVQVVVGHRSSKSREGTDGQVAAGHSSNKSHEGTDGKAEAGHSSGNKNSSKKKEKLQYLMLLGILAASMTYQTGLKPPGGLWQDNNDGHYAGNPILRDINKDRYNAFFYSNSASFMASIVVVVMLLPLTLLPEKYTIESSEKDTNLSKKDAETPDEDTQSLDKVLNLPKEETELPDVVPKSAEEDPKLPEKDTWPLWPMHTAILLDMMGLLVAYAAGSTRKWETSRNIMVLAVPVLAYIGLYVALSVFRHRKEESTAPPPAVQPWNHCKTCMSVGSTLVFRCTQRQQQHLRLRCMHGCMSAWQQVKIFLLARAAGVP